VIIVVRLLGVRQKIGERWRSRCLMGVRFGLAIGAQDRSSECLFQADLRWMQ